MPKVSICLPTHDMQNKDFFLGRCLKSIEQQTFKDYEVVITENGKGMAPNTNEAIQKAKGDIVKILFMDDFLAHPYSLQNIVKTFKGGWLVTGCIHNDGVDNFNPHYPTYSAMIHRGENTIGSPSVLAFENKEPLLFDETMTWLLDVDLYKRLYARYGEPTILNELNVGIGLHSGQTTHLLSNKIKRDEYIYLLKKYERR